MPVTVVTSALAELRTQVAAAQVALARAGAVTWTGRAADAADVRRGDLLAALRRCEQALDALDRAAAAARAAQLRCGTPAPLLGAARPAPGPVTPWG